MRTEEFGNRVTWPGHDRLEALERIGRLDGVDYVGLSTGLQPRAARIMPELRMGQRLTTTDVDRPAACRAHRS